MALTSGSVIGDTEHRKAIGSLDMKYIPILRVGNVRIIVPRNFIENLASNGASIRQSCRKLGQNHRSPRHQRVNYRHERGDKKKIDRLRQDRLL